MSYTTMRRLDDSERLKGLSNPSRRWIALSLTALSLAAAYLLLSRDIDWEKRRREARALGVTAQTNANHLEARRYYEMALSNHPYDWETHLSLAVVLNHYLNDYDNALRHYLYALAYATDNSVIEQAQKEIEILKLIRSGELENPVHALEDMFSAVEANAGLSFRRRLSFELSGDFFAYWNAWGKRGRGTPVYCRIESRRDGFYDAMIELEFPDGTSMSMHLQSTRQDIWRLELSFP